MANASWLNMLYMATSRTTGAIESLPEDVEPQAVDAIGDASRLPVILSNTLGHIETGRSKGKRCSIQGRL